MQKKKGKRLKLLRGEIAMYIAIILLILVVIPVLNVYTCSIITKSNIEVEKLKSNIEKQKEENESLSMQIDELASLENIQEIAKEYGLSYNNTNILKVK